MSYVWNVNWSMNVTWAVWWSSEDNLAITHKMSSIWMIKARDTTSNRGIQQWIRMKSSSRDDQMNKTIKCEQLEKCSSIFRLTPKCKALSVLLIRLITFSVSVWPSAEWMSTATDHSANWTRARSLNSVPSPEATDASGQTSDRYISHMSHRMRR